MNKLKGSIILIIFIFSWCALYWLTGSRTPWNTFITEENGKSISIYLGDIPVENYDRMGFTKAILQYVAAVDGWLVGTERGELFLFDNEGKQLWKRSLGIGKLISVAISNDQTMVFIGEQSPEGNLYGINIHTGAVVWKYSGADFVGAISAKRSYPSIVHIAVDNEDNVYANIYRFMMNNDGSREYNAKMIAVRKSGELLWQYPENEVIDSWINWCDVNDQNDKVVWSTSTYDLKKDVRYKDTIYFLDRKTGQSLNSVTVPAIEPYDNTVMRGSPNFSADGKYLAGVCSDGRAFLFDENGQVLWGRTISKPAQIDDTWINASGRDAYVLNQGVLFTTINTFNRENWQLPTPVEHPSSNSLYMFNLDGSFRYQYRARGTIEDLDFANNIVACAVGRNVRTHDYQAHGALLMELLSGVQKQFFHTKGPLQAIAINNAGTVVAGVEAPAVTVNGKIIGAYRLHIWNVLAQEKS